MQAQKAEGTRDLIGAEMRAWQKMQQIAAGVFEPFGFKLIETAAIPAGGRVRSRYRPVDRRRAQGDVPRV